MRDLVSRIVWNPWVYRLTCAAVTLAAMVGVGVGLRALKATGETTFILEVGVPVLVGIFLIGWLMQRAGIGPEQVVTRQAAAPSG